MERSRLFPRVCLLVTAVLTVLGVTLRSVCMLTAFDTAVGYFDKGILTTLSNALYFAAVISAAVCASLIPKGELPSVLRTRLRRSAAYLWGLSLAIFTVGVLLTCYQARTSNFLTYPMVLGILSSLYFFISGDKSGTYSDALSALGFIPVVWCVTAAWETYTDQFTAMNSPIKVGLQMGFLGLALILISELRFRLGKPLPRVAAAFMSIGVFTSLSGSIPVLLGTGARILYNQLHLFYAIVLLCGGLYGAYTLFQLLWFPAETEAQAPEAAAEVTAEPTAEVTEPEPPTDIPNAQ
jgi:hypothetical protein